MKPITAAMLLRKEETNDLPTVSETAARPRPGERGDGRKRLPGVLPPAAGETPQPCRFDSAAAARRFITGGNATVTLRSQVTQTRYTYKIRRAENDRPNQETYFVNLLAGPDNESDFRYLGILRDNVFRLTAKSRLSLTSAPVKAFAWAWANLMQGTVPAKLEIWHEGRCCRCNRKLTVPESIASGIGPECAGRVS